MTWPVLLLFTAFWIADYRRKGYPWDQTLATLVFALLVLLPLAWLTPGWVWKTVLMAYMTFPWWYTPFLLLRRPIAVGEPRMRVLDPADDPVWPGLVAMVERGARALEAEGLVRIGVLREDMAAEVTTLTAHLESPDGTEVVTVYGATSMILPGTEAAERRTHLDTGVGMHFADGRKLGLANTIQPVGAGAGILVSLPSVDDPARLLRIARAYRARWFADAQLVPPRGDTPLLEYWAGRHRRAMEAMAARGLYRRRPDGTWGLTVLGVLVMPWSVMFPFRQVRELRVRLRERRILRALGMEAQGEAAYPRPRPRHGSDLQGAAAVALAILFLLMG